MIGTKALDQFLLNDSADVGCDRAMELLHLYVELVANDDADQRAPYAGVEVHLAACRISTVCWLL